MFFTRIPVPKSTGYSLKNLNKSVRYFPLVGGVIGGAGALVFIILQLFLPFYVAITLSMASTVFITGAFHEDGFADFCDGFGGGYTKERIMTIMKDSRIGTYGSVGLILILATKFTSLISFDVQQIPFIIIAAHVFSRFNPVLLMYSASYVREDDSAKAKPVGDHVSKISLIVAGLFSACAMLMFPWQKIILIVFISISVLYLLSRYVKRKVGGYTGDVLGALQQLTEVSFYLSILASDSLINL